MAPAPSKRTKKSPPAPLKGGLDDPFATFGEWAGEADDAAYSSLDETEYLSRSPANAGRLM